MNEKELKHVKWLAAQAIEEYLNRHERDLEQHEEFPATSDYFLLDKYKDILITEAYMKGEK